LAGSVRRRRLLLILATALAVAACSGSSTPAAARSPTTAAPTPSTAQPATSTVWVCRPGEPSAPCTTNLNATVVASDGTRTKQPFVAARAPRADCFYVYPTVSTAAADNAPLVASPEVVAAVHAQAALFSSVCRVFAPVYRQITLRGLLTGRYLDKAAQATAYDDVRDAWRDYLAHDNGGRPFVLIGHSQGALVLTHLIQQEIDRVPAVRSRLVSAILLGGNVTVPTGKDVGGDFTAVPACRRSFQGGCVIAYSSFASPPPANALFGRTALPGRQVLCTDPSVLAGGQGAVTPYVPADRVTGGPSALPGTGFVAYPYALRVGCRTAGGATWLQVSQAPDGVLPPFQQQLGPTWGLHVADVTIALADLVEAVRRQADAHH
jgi:pimeloyl-ACP methyl ester carboxylesterase